MSRKLVPNLKKITVPTGKLILDPNNPRLITRDEDRYEEIDYTDKNVQYKTMRKLRGSNTDSYKIKQLENSIKENGWIPVDSIFVKKHTDGENYVVLEGNRRIAAIRNILSDENSDENLRKELENIEVMEILVDEKPDEIKQKISYLLGVRHHGSLITWTPFAQAHNIFKRYLEITEYNSKSFVWNNAKGQEIADALSITLKQVEERLKVYRVMMQIGEMPEVIDSPGGIKDRYYSVCSEVILNSKTQLKKYIYQDQSTFLLDKESLFRMNNLCHFDQPNRKEAPIRNPQEWRKLENILRDDDQNRKEEMLFEVEENKRPPSDVWAERAAELITLEWDKWLLKVNSVLKRVTLGDDITSEEAKQPVKRLVKLINTLDEKDALGEKL